MQVLRPVGERGLGQRGGIDATSFLGDFRQVTPVSYTHLRAHETVLDLVCRLLLEKKKDTTHNDGCHP